MTLTKSDIVLEIYKQHENMTKASSADAFESILRLAKDAMIHGDGLLLSSFGKFVVKEKSQRMGRNPQTGDAMMLPPRRVVTFHPSGILRRKVNNK